MKFDENHDFLYEFMKKTYDFGGSKKGLRMNSCTLIHTLIHIHT